MRILFTVSLRFPPQGKSAEGEAVPKARPKGVVDGQLVNIPAHLIRCPRGTHESSGVDPYVGPLRQRACRIERCDACPLTGKGLEPYKPVMIVPRKSRREIMLSDVGLRYGHLSPR